MMFGNEHENRTLNIKFLRSIWGYSSAGRAPALQAGGQRFDPAYLHQSEYVFSRHPGIKNFPNLKLFQAKASIIDQGTDSRPARGAESIIGAKTVL